MSTTAPSQSRLREPSQRVSPSARWMWVVGALLESVFLLLAFLLIAYVWAPFDVPWWVSVLVVLALATYVVVVPLWRYAVHRWEVTDTAVYTQVGWWTRERRIAPMSRIQTVDYSEGAIERLFGLASVTVTTASAAGALEISGLDRELAQRLAEELTVQADAVPGDAT
ncbi:MAG TPA: PH domain-containing protein [Nocardioides sp.]|nr:PH domain-containing protein [Nocardioides sp.]